MNHFNASAGHISNIWLQLPITGPGAEAGTSALLQFVLFMQWTLLAFQRYDPHANALGNNLGSWPLVEGMKPNFLESHKHYALLSQAEDV